MKIRRRVYRSGKVAWQVDLGVIDGRRVQRAVETEAEARRVLAAERRRRELHGRGLSGLTPGEVADVIAAREMLGGEASLIEAARAWLELRGGELESRTVGEALEAWLADKWETERSAGYRRQLRVSVGALVRHVGEVTLLRDLTREVIEGWLRGNAWAPKTRNNYLGDVSAWLSWCVGRKWLRENVALEIGKVRLPDGEIETLGVEACERLLRGALEETGVMGAVVLGLFGGLRSAEIQRVTWEEIDMEERTVVVLGRKAKSRQRRVVDLTVEAVEWLRRVPVEDRQGPVCGRNWSARWRVFRARCGWDVGESTSGGLTPSQMVVIRCALGGPRWPKNALRHTYASMHYAAHQDEAKLQAQMGHESAAMLHRHYRALRTRAEAVRFWALRP